MSTSSTLGPGSDDLLVFGALVLIGILSVSLSGCTDRPADETAASSSVPDTINTLAEAERDAGWQLLFDGESIDGWRGYQRDSMPGGWTVEKGALHFEGEGPNSTTIITTEQFDHFDLRFEWKVDSLGNSGVMYRVLETDGPPYHTGPEYQVLDNAVHADANEPKHEAGALYGLYAPSTDVTRPVGQYNEARIVVRGNHVEHWLNGTKLLEAEIGSKTWKERVAGTKFADWPDFAQATTGYIALQDHNHPVWYRDIKLRPLNPDT